MGACGFASWSVRTSGLLLGDSGEMDNDGLFHLSSLQADATSEVSCRMQEYGGPSALGFDPSSWSLNVSLPRIS